MSSGKRRNPLNLSLPPTVNEEGLANDVSATEENEGGEGGEGQGQQTTAKGTGTPPTTMMLDSQLKQLSLSGAQIERMNEWINLKKQVFNLI